MIIQVKKKHFTDAIKNHYKACGNMGVLSCVHTKIINNTLVLVSTDGNRLLETKKTLAIRLKIQTL